MGESCCRSDAYLSSFISGSFTLGYGSFYPWRVVWASMYMQLLIDFLIDLLYESIKKSIRKLWINKQFSCLLICLLNMSCKVQYASNFNSVFFIHSSIKNIIFVTHLAWTSWGLWFLQLCQSIWQVCHSKNYSREQFDALVWISDSTLDMRRVAYACANLVPIADFWSGSIACSIARILWWSKVVKPK